MQVLIEIKWRISCIFTVEKRKEAADFIKADGNYQRIMQISPLHPSLIILSSVSCILALASDGIR